MGQVLFGRTRTLTDSPDRWAHSAAGCAVLYASWHTRVARACKPARTRLFFALALHTLNYALNLRKAPQMGPRQ